VAKTKLLLAFGAHGSSKIKGDGKFFRNAITPFLEEHVAKGRGKAALIHEGMMFGIIENEIIGNGLAAEAKPEPKRTMDILDWMRKERKRLLARVEMVVSEFGYSSSCSTRKSEEAERSGSMSWGHFGHEKYAVRLNRKEPGAVRFFMEPQNAEAIYLEAYGHMLDLRLRQVGKDIKLATECMKVFIKTIKLRDKGVKDLADRLVSENPGIAIIIPRGRAHAPMEAMFERSRYDVSLRIGSPSALPFENDAMIRSYRSPLSRRELRLYAKLEQEIYIYGKSIGFDLEADKPDKHFLKIARQNNESPIKVLERVYLQARAYVIAKNPEIARELGIKS